MEQYTVTGMSCAACAARVEKAVTEVSGVAECAVNLLTNSMTVKGSAKADDIILAVEKAGYGATLTEKNSNLKTKPQNTVLKRLIASSFFKDSISLIIDSHCCKSKFEIMEISCSVILNLINMRFKKAISCSCIIESASITCIKIKINAYRSIFVYSSITPLYFP